MSERPGVGRYFTKCSVGRFGTRYKKWTQSDLKFCKNEGSIRPKTNEKGGQLDWKLIQNGKNLCKILKTCLN